MGMMLYLGIMLVAAFLLQGLFGFIQIKNFTENYRKMRQRGRVLIGKNPKRFQAGTILLLVIDREGNIQEARVMKGITIFVKFKPLSRVVGRNIVDIATDYEFMIGVDRLTRGCILNAYRNFVNFKTNQLSYEDLNTSIDIFAMPMFARIKSGWYWLIGTVRKRTDMGRKGL
ncbi:transcriptional regulator GutM [Lactiplantibacillus pentosus]|jgi:DNA-binding transcriptional regulator of glucitol operon|uniref:Transcriptional regulator GutM n=3 Tax=Lactiplantibacillus pentosus TaxID=1589 RepID=A0AAX6LHL7_LACPE|nr:transcriptional regulator GutM [Lactiplantibacillus pentosus]AYJ43373.1 transcriptional regulator [Lactiplantibacillus pentosus]KRK23220.1 sorbitol operon activator [Lactiplantibacillus pentosus DSM 20314]MCT0161599.1 transcriptional regulator [Lactiplantibacillus pentosus]MCT3287435.1 transcriptional regulator [Lactiplantibacillus pentosus]MCT3294961.1 transcriptional regulator [Lactiplantibacillus pentosus]